MIRFALPLALLTLAAAAGGRVVDYALPDETPVALPPGRGAEAVEAACAACHSLDYVTTQPPGKGAAFWGDTVKKMVDRYGAVVPDADRADIVDYLARHY